MGGRGGRDRPRHRRGRLLPGARRRPSRRTPERHTISLGAVASPSASPAILASEGFVYPGTYVPAFDPGLTFTIDHQVDHNCAPDTRCRGTIDANLAGWIGIEFGQPEIEMNVVRIDKVNDPANPGELMDPPADLAAWIASRPGVTVTAQKAVQVGGLAGTQLDVRTGNDDPVFGPIPGVTDPPARTRRELDGPDVRRDGRWSSGRHHLACRGWLVDGATATRRIRSSGTDRRAASPQFALAEPVARVRPGPTQSITPPSRVGGRGSTEAPTRRAQFPVNEVPRWRP